MLSISPLLAFILCLVTVWMKPEHVQKKHKAEVRSVGQRTDIYGVKEPIFPFSNQSFCQETQQLGTVLCHLCVTSLNMTNRNALIKSKPEVKIHSSNRSYEKGAGVTSTLNRDKEHFSFLPSGKIKIGSLFLSATCSLSLWKQKERLKQFFSTILFPGRCIKNIFT